MKYDYLESYRFFDFDQTNPRLYCKFQSCVVSKGDGCVKFYTGDYYYPVCMLLFNMSEIDLFKEEANDKIDVLHIKSDNNKEYKIYAHK